VLHLGDHKTGSTSIQTALASGAVAAAGRSLCYPMGRPRRWQHNHIVRALIRRSRGADLPDPFPALAAEIAAAGADITILSAENFEFADPAAVRAALETHLPGHMAGLALVVYLRPHAERLVSTHAEQVKQGLFAGDLAAFHAEALADGRFRYAPRLARWRAVFGDRLTVRPMVRAALKDGDVVADFLDIACAGAAVTRPVQAVRNAKATVPDLALLAAVQAALAPLRGQGPGEAEPVRALGWRLARMLDAARVPGAAEPALHRPLAAAVAAAYAGDAAAVDRDFLGGAAVLAPQLAAAPDRAVAAAQSLALEDNFDAEALRVIRAWLPVLAAIFAHRPGDWPAHFRARPLMLGGERGGA
jgi:hypothetical protein